MPRRPSLISRIKAASVAVEAPVEAPVEAAVEAPVEQLVEAAVEAPVEQPVEAPVEQLVEAAVEAPVEQLVEMVRIPGDIHAAVGRLYRRLAVDNDQRGALADLMSASLYAHAQQPTAPAPVVFGLDDPAVAAFVDGMIAGRSAIGGVSYSQVVDGIWRFLFAALVYAENIDPDEDGDVSRPV